MKLTSENGARMAGYTLAVFAEGGPYSLSLYIRPDADLDGTFLAFDRDECELIQVNGWAFTFESNAED